MSKWLFFLTVKYTLFVLQISLPGLYQTLCFEDEGLWHAFSQSSVCEQDFPSTIVKGISLFQQVIFSY